MLGRKGTQVDMIFIVLFVMIFFAMMILLSTYLADQIFPQLQSLVGAGTKAETVIKTARQGYSTLDNIFLVMFFLLNMVPVLLAILVRNHPAFIFINIIIIIIYMLVAPALSNAMRQFWLTPEFAQYASGGGGSYTYYMMTNVFMYMPYISVGLSIILMLAMFYKPQGADM